MTKYQKVCIIPIHTTFDNRESSRMIEWDSIITSKQTPADSIPAIIQQADNGKVLMLVYLTEEAFEQTIASEVLVLFSRKTQAMRVQGESRDCTLKIVDITPNCGNNCLLIQVDPQGDLDKICHHDRNSCFAPQP